MIPLTIISRERLSLLGHILTKKEKIFAGIFFCLALVSGTVLGIQVRRAYSIAIPARGGTFEEGVIGIPRFINPLLAASDTDRDLVNIIYAGLMRFDREGNIVPDLTETYSISEDGRTYTFTLPEHARWSDGEPLTADDILFTITLAQNPSYRSPLRANWEGVAAEKIDARTITFFLQKPYAPFLENTTLGILPKHIWKDILPEEFPLTEWNLKPVGAGPYQVTRFEKNSSGRITRYHLEINPFFLPTPPFIEHIVLHFFSKKEDAFSAFSAGTIDALGSFPPASRAEAERQGNAVHLLTLPRVFGIFFNQNSSLALAEKTVRDALELATNKPVLVEQILGNAGTAIYAPIPPGTFGAEESNVYADRVYNTKKAAALLEAGGWKLNEETGIREKKKEDVTLPLAFALSTSNAAELIETARLLEIMWKDIGADVQINIFELGDFEQNVLRPRKYDALLFGEVVSHDPDPFAFWHSSQRNDPGLNIALYTNPTVDTILEEARATIDKEKRGEQYRKFQQELAKDIPAIFLYSPRYLYVTSPQVHGIVAKNIITPADRFNHIHEWYIKTDRAWNIGKRY